MKQKKEREETEKGKAKKEEKRQEMVMKGATAMEFTDSYSDTWAQTGSSSSDGGISLPKRIRPINIVTPEVAASLDRMKTSDRMAVHNLASISRAVGRDPAELALN